MLVSVVCTLLYASLRNSINATYNIAAIDMVKFKEVLK